MIGLIAKPGPSGWVRVEPRAYSEACRVAMRAIPGVQWEGSWWSVPVDVWPRLREFLEESRIARVDARSLLDDLAAPERLTVDDPDLRGYQREGVAWLVERLASQSAAMLADEMGLGKTVQALVVADFLWARKALVVCPSVMRKKWLAEGTKWYPELDLRATTYDTLRSRWGSKQEKNVSWVRELLDGVELIFVDEIHYVGNPRSKRSKALRAAIDHVRARNPKVKVLALSGTPMTDRPSDLWFPLDTLFPNRFGSKFTFEKRYCAGQFVEIEGLDRAVWQAAGTSRSEELSERLGHVMLRRTKDIVGQEIPPLTRQLLPVELPAKIARAQSREARELAKGDKRHLSQLLTLTEAAKLEHAAELAEELQAAGHAPLIVTTRKRSVDVLEKRLGSECGAVDGDDPPDERQRILNSYSLGVATMHSITIGIDLIGFDCMIFAGLDWTPSTLQQVEARLHRIGQQRNVMVYYLIGEGTLDELVRDRVISKLEAFDAIVGSGSEEGALAETLGGGTEEDLIAAIVEAL